MNRTFEFVKFNMKNKYTTGNLKNSIIGFLAGIVFFGILTYNDNLFMLWIGLLGVFIPFFLIEKNKNLLSYYQYLGIGIISQAIYMMSIILSIVIVIFASIRIIGLYSSSYYNMWLNATNGISISDLIILFITIFVNILIIVNTFTTRKIRIVCNLLSSITVFLITIDTIAVVRGSYQKDILNVIVHFLVFGLIGFLTVKWNKKYMEIR